MFLPHPRVKVSIVGSLRDREVACSASDCQGSNFESCVWRTVSSQSSHHPQEVLLAQFSLYVHKGGLKPDSFHFIYYHCIYMDYSQFAPKPPRPSYPYLCQLAPTNSPDIYINSPHVYMLYASSPYKYQLALHLYQEGDSLRRKNNSA